MAGLPTLAAAEEQALLAAAAAPDDDRGSPDSWAAAPVVAHNNQFKSQQAERIRLSGPGQVPPVYGEVDHSSAEVYQGYQRAAAGRRPGRCRWVSAELIDGTWALPDEDLLDPARHPWLTDGMLWLQIVVRGFWHPTGHLGDYYLAHGQPGRAVALQAQALAMARYLDAPAPRRAWRLQPGLRAGPGRPAGGGGPDAGRGHRGQP